MRAEYDFSKGVRGKYAGRIAARGTVCYVPIDADVAKVFPTPRHVNRALRGLAKILAAQAK